MTGSIKLHILNSTGSLSEFEGRIMSAFQLSVESARSFIPVEQIDVIVSDNPDQVIPESGICGMALGSNVVWISVDSSSKNFRENIEYEIKSTIAHEFHHCLRIRACGNSTSLADALVMDGLACQFEFEVTGQIPIYGQALSESQLSASWQLAGTELWSTGYSHSDWFYGSADGRLPRWTGYSLGLMIIQKYLSLNADRSAAKLVSAPTKTFFHGEQFAPPEM